ncbi:hypothetical protein L6452_03357 [Arctium lappa]|uniref:Uncharacterized protein n=1 Tax=Arctium lappa TaxID=4217 RepID=A0ACB9FMH7_ARCLA|nr:hypothetical protein L6452_03357 [Arctium lappa]
MLLQLIMFTISLLVRVTKVTGTSGSGHVQSSSLRWAPANTDQHKPRPVKPSPEPETSVPVVVNGPESSNVYDDDVVIRSSKKKGSALVVMATKEAGIAATGTVCSSEPTTDDNVQATSAITNEELVQAGLKSMDETDQAIERSKQTEQMGRIVNDLDACLFMTDDLMSLCVGCYRNWSGPSIAAMCDASIYSRRWSYTVCVAEPHSDFATAVPGDSTDLSPGI